MEASTADKLRQWAEYYNNPRFFEEDPIAFPTMFAKRMAEGSGVLQDVEIAGLLAAHLAWGRRAMIVRDSNRLFDEMNWKPYDYVMSGEWRDDSSSLHRTIKWSEIAAICSRLRSIYSVRPSIEGLDIQTLRCGVFGSNPDRNAANKKINMFRRWMVRRDGRVDLGLWKSSDPADLLIPLDVHVLRSANMLGLTSRTSANAITVNEITKALEEVFPGDPCLGDYALFGHGVTQGAIEKEETDNA